MSSPIPEGEHAAHWWLPGRKDCRVAGRYAVRPDGSILLEFYEDLEEKLAEPDEYGMKSWSPINTDIYPILHGEANGVAITAVSCRLHSLNASFTDTVRVEQRQPKYTIESAHHYLGELDLQFKRARFRPPCLSVLTGWDKHHVIEHNHETSGSVSYNLATATQAAKTGTFRGTRITLSQEFGIDIANDTDAVTLSKQGLISLAMPGNARVDEICSLFIRPIMYMMTLLSGQPEGVSTFEVSSDDFPWPQDELPAGAVPDEQWMHVRLPVLRRPENVSRVRPPLMLLDLVSWPDAVETWLTWASTAQAELQLMYLLLDPKYPWLEVRFISCAQMIEGMHRKSFPVSVESIEQNTALADLVMSKVREIDGLNSSQRNRIKGALKYLYEPSLENRIKALDIAAGDVVGGIGNVDIRLVARECAKLRNAFAHSTEQRPVVNLRNVQIAHAALFLIGFSFLLTKLSVPEAAAGRTVKNWDGTRSFEQLVSNYWQVLAEDPARRRPADLQ